MPIAEVGVREVLAVLEPIWRTKNETASKLLGRIEAILTHARAKELRHDDCESAWKKDPTGGVIGVQKGPPW